MTVEVKNLSKCFAHNKEVLSDVNLTMPTGQITTILGPSGSGKTTLLRIIAGLENPNWGEIHVDGRDITCLPPQEREIGFVFQNYALFKHMNVYDNIAFGLRIKKWTGSQIRDRVMELLVWWGWRALRPE
jgi:sulfate transport system ATP-binding protein